MPGRRKGRPSASTRWTPFPDGYDTLPQISSSRNHESRTPVLKANSDVTKAVLHRSQIGLMWMAPHTSEAPGCRRV